MCSAGSTFLAQINWPGSVCLGNTVICHKSLQNTLEGRTHFPTITEQNSHISEGEKIDLWCRSRLSQQWCTSDPDQVNAGIPLISWFFLLPLLVPCINSHQTWTLPVPLVPLLPHLSSLWAWQASHLNFSITSNQSFSEKFSSAEIHKQHFL